MRVVDLPPVSLHAIGAIAGLGGGAIAGRLADLLPARYEIAPEHMASGARRTRRNAALLALGGAAGLALAQVAYTYPSTQIALAMFWIATNLALVVALLAASAVDVEHMILPDELTIGGALLSLVTAHYRSVGLRASLVGAAVGFLVAYVPHVVYKRLRGQSGQGFGDTKLLVMAGAWQGLEGALFVLFAGALQSVLCGVVMRVVGVSFPVPDSVRAEIAEIRRLADAGDPEARALLADDPMAGDPAANEALGAAGAEQMPRGVLTTRLPLGPFLALGCVEFLFARSAVLELFQRYLAPH